MSTTNPINAINATNAMNITIIGGSGYVGFITGLGLANLGNSVINVDINDDKVAMMNAGTSPIYEEDIDLSQVLQRNLDAGRIQFTTDLQRGVNHGEVIFIAVGTPEKENGEADLSQVIGVAEEIVNYVDSYKVLVMKSTVPVGTVELIGSILNRKRQEGQDFDIVSNPEFLREGKGLYDFFNPTRIVIGTNSDRACQIMRQLYAPFLSPESSCFERNKRHERNKPHEPDKPPTTNYKPRADTPLMQTDIASAQMIKYASNTFLATRISFINEIAGLCERIGADVKEIARGMGYDDRIGHEYLEPGIGFGGPCLEKDLKALIRIAENNDYQPNFLRAVLEKNDHQIRQVVNKVKELAGYPLYRKIIAVFGLAFKAGTNDVRTSLALRIIDQLQDLGAEIHAHDPQAISEAKQLKPDIEYFEDPYEAVRHADALVILTDWPEYQELDYRRVKDLLAYSNVVDGRNLLDAREMEELGFNYRGIGRC